MKTILTIKYIFITLMTFLMPIKGLVILAGAFVIADTILGIYATVKLKGWKSFKSNKFFNIAVKSFFYIGSILLGFLVDTYILEGKMYNIENIVSKVVTMVWILIEAKSMDETSVKLGNRPILEIVKSFIDTAKNIKKDINEVK